MSLYETWFKKAYTNDGHANATLWNEFMPKEQKIYEYILENKVKSLDGTIEELAKKFDMSSDFFIGFIDGINDIQEPKFDVNTLEESSNVSIKIDFAKLYQKMVEFKADHLYTLDAWKNIFTEDELKNLYRGQKSSRTIVNEKKPERNDPCPCGSGKKYKKCCGLN